MESLFQDAVAPFTRFIEAHAHWAGPVVFAICFLESLALVSAIIPATVLLIGRGAAYPALSVAFGERVGVVGALSIEFSNPRHAHEYAALRKHPLPDHMLLLAGTIETTSNIVEHPEVVARRIEEAVAAVGDRERVVASTDCGFGTFTNREWVIEPVVWLKLQALRAGADLASARLWGKKN